MSTPSIVVATDGSQSRDLRVRDAATSARERQVPLHVVCSVRPQTREARRRLADALPRDLGHYATDAGQREAAMSDVRGLIGHFYSGVELHVTSSTRRPAAAERAVAARVGGEVYGTTSARIKWRPALRLRLRPRPVL